MNMNMFTKVLILITFTVAGLGCGYSKHSTSNPPSTPTISALIPASATHGGSQFSLEVDGMNFASNAVINFNGSDETTTFVSNSKLTTMIPASAIANAGTVPVKVKIPATGGLYGTPEVDSAPVNFTIN